MGYKFSPELYWRVNYLSWAFAGLSIVLSIFILSSALYLYSKPQSRHTVDRISFRLLCWAMGVEIVYGTMYIAIYAGHAERLGNAPCGFLVYVMLASMLTANWLCTSVAVNLMLIIVFNINPFYRRLERWYVGASFFLGMFPPLVPAALGHFGIDKSVYGTCYLTDMDLHTRVTNLILDIYLWQGLSCVIATISTISVLVVFLKSSRQTSRALFAGNPLNNQVIASATIGTLNHRFILIALRISAYPIALIIINTFLTTADLVYTITEMGADTLGEWVLFATFICLYGGRGVVLALLVIFVDPCLRRGLKALRTPSMSDLTPPGGVSVIDVDYSMNQQDSSVRGVVSTTFDSVGLQTPPPSDMEEKSLGSTDTSGLHTLSLHRMGQGTMGEEEVSKLYQSAEAQL